MIDTQRIDGWEQGCVLKLDVVFYLVQIEREAEKPDEEYTRVCGFHAIHNVKKWSSSRRIFFVHFIIKATV